MIASRRVVLKYPLGGAFFSDLIRNLLGRSRTDIFYNGMGKCGCGHNSRAPLEPWLLARYTTDMNIYQATSELLTKAGFYALRPNGRNFILSASSFAIRVDRPGNDYTRFRATDLLADDWEVIAIPAQQSATEAA